MTGFTLFALEDTYNTVPATGWRDVGVKGDPAKSKTPKILGNDDTMHRRTGAPRLAGRRIIDMGAEGDAPMNLMSNGLGMFLACCATSATSAVVEGGTLAFQQVFKWAAGGVPVGAGLSISAEVYRERTAGAGGFDGYDVFDYSGGKPTGWKLTQDTEGGALFVPSIDYAPKNNGSRRLTVDPDRTFLEVIEDIRFAWPDCTVVLTPLAGGAPVDCVSSIELTVPTGAKIDKLCLNRTQPRDEPYRDSTPKPTGSLKRSYDDPQFYDAFVSGAAYGASLNFRGPVAIEDDTFPEIQIDIGAIVFEQPNDPQGQNDGETTQDLTFVVVDPELLDEDDVPVPVITWTQITSDADF